MEKTEKELKAQAIDAARVDLENPNYYGTCPEKEMNGDHPVSNSPLHLFTASAGSGKTWRLAFEYISLLLKEAYHLSENKQETCTIDNYRHILAITFTNKATAEMKDRILLNLEMLSDPEYPDKNDRDKYLEQLSNRLCVSPEVVAKRAQLVYSNLLHDYSHFHIQTIDSFFQSVLRNLAQELGIGAYWDVELDSESVLKEAAHRLLNRVCTDKNLRSWVTDYVKSRIDANKNWNVEGELVNFGANLFSEALVTNDEMDYFLSNESGDIRVRIKKIKDILFKAKQNLWDSVKKPAGDFVTLCERNGVPPEAFAYTRTIYTFVSTLAKGEHKDPSAKVTEFVNAGNVDEMLQIGIVKKYRNDVSGIVTVLQQLVADAKSAYESNFGKIIVVDQILKNINQIGLLADLKEEVANLQDEKNIFMLAYAQPLLHKFIKNDDAPFVFERIGERLRYMMIDEFQDTSKVQYQNFRPLIENCCSSNSGSLIVGDAKQAIYRFRNGDWSLIESLRSQSEGARDNDEELRMDTGIYGHNMQFNYRSAPVVVNFNNALFESVSSDEKAHFYEKTFEKSIVSLLDDANGVNKEYLRQIYSTSHQFSVDDKGGFVKVLFHKKAEADAAEETPWSKAALLSEIKRLNENGVKYEDITILSRFNKDIPLIAEFLKKNGIPVVSDLAFLLRASIRVRMIMDAFRYIDSHMVSSSFKPKDSLYKQELVSDYYRSKSSTNKEYAKLDTECSVVDGWCKYFDGITPLDNSSTGDRLPELPIYDMAEQIYHLMFPDETTDVFVQSFFDHLRDFLARKAATLHDVINYWEEKLSTVSIPADPKMVKGVKMMSIHKSKGLEAHTVILASCSWKVTSDHSFSFWCEGKNKFEDELSDIEIPLVPVDFTADLQKTSFENEYWEEMAQLHAENVNLFYVALTRAKKNLIVIDEYSIPNNETTPNLISATMGRLLYEVVSSSNSLVEENLSVGDAQFSTEVFEYGQIVASKAAEETKDNVELVDGTDTFSVKGTFRQSAAANRFVRNGNLDDDENVVFGNTVHALLEKINGVDDCSDLSNHIARAVNELMIEGDLAAEDAENYESVLMDAFSNLDPSVVEQWFGAHLKTHAESNIANFEKEEDDESADLKESRPDRVVYNAETNTYVVVDYKTGKFSEAKFDDHSQQVADYMKLISEISPLAGVEGYVWYVCENKVKPVSL